MGLEELTFRIEGTEVTLKAEVRRKRYSANLEYPFAEVPMKLQYRDLENNKVQEEGYLNYDLKNKKFVTSFVTPNLRALLAVTEPDREDVLYEWGKELEKIGKTYATLLSFGIVKEKNYFKNSQGEWKEVGDGADLLSEKELLGIADAVK